MSLNPLSIEDVQTCKQCVTLGQEHVPSEGSPSADVMIIGQSPGETEVEAGKPFCGPSGELLDFMLDVAELSRSEVYIANALKCRPPGNRPGQVAELQHCWMRWLRWELRAVDPQIVVVVGRDAHSVLLGKRAPFKHGEIVRSKKRAYLMTWHPAYCLRTHRIEQFVDDTGLKLKELHEALT